MCEKELIEFEKNTYILTDNVVADDGITLEAGSLVEAADGSSTSFQTLRGEQCVFTLPTAAMPLLTQVKSLAEWERARVPIIMKIGRKIGTEVS